MQWLNDVPFGDSRVVQFGLLAACGIAALVILAVIYRLVFAHRLRVPAARTRQPRLGLVDAFSLDGQRQLVLVRRDNVEHLIMIGGPNDVLVESQISRAFAAARENSAAAQPVPARRAEPSGPPPSDAAAAAAPRPVAEAASVKAPGAAAAGEQKPAAAAAPLIPAAGSKPGQPPAPPLAGGTPARPVPAARAMPPPIAPLGRANLARPLGPASEPSPPAQPAEQKNALAPVAASVPPIAHPDKLKPAPLARLERPASVTLAARSDAAAWRRPNKADAPGGESALESSPGPTAPVEVPATMAPPAGNAPAIAKAKMNRIEPPPAEKPEPGAHSAAAETAAQEDPFAGLDSLEAEMARLLGREKLN